VTTDGIISMIAVSACLVALVTCAAARYLAASV
jgi:hypothetical protein